MRLKRAHIPVRSGMRSFKADKNVKNVRPPWLMHRKLTSSAPCPNRIGYILVPANRPRSRSRPRFTPPNGTEQPVIPTSSENSELPAAHPQVIGATPVANGLFSSQYVLVCFTLFYLVPPWSGHAHFLSQLPPHQALAPISCLSAAQRSSWRREKGGLIWFNLL